jgi:dienelactone hydrolase
MKPDKSNASTRFVFVYAVICLLFQSQLYLNAQNNKPILSKGIIIDTVLCNGYSTESYSLYLPDNYSESVAWPVLLIFDPGARGHIGIENFIPAGKKYGYILACSNNVHNGNFSRMLSDADIMYNDVVRRFKIDNRRIFTAGFSGGSRLATGFSINNKEISGVIGCGAGMPNSDYYSTKQMSHLLYFGIAGIKDMNYLEMTDLSRRLTETGIKSYYLVFNGGHQWPSERNLEYALGWFELQMMNKGIIEKRNDFLDDFLIQMIDRAKESEASSDLLCSKEYYEYAIRDYSGSPAIPGLIASVERIEKNEAYRKSLKESKKNYKEEVLKRAEYSKAFADIAVNQAVPDSILNWWKNEVHILSSKIRGKRNSDSLMAYRLLNMITIASIEYGSNLITAGNYRTAAGFFSVWTICEPDKKNSWYNLARVYAFDGQNDKAVSDLGISIKKGFTNKKFICNDTAFKFIVNDKRFQKLINDIK